MVLYTHLDACSNTKSFRCAIHAAVRAAADRGLSSDCVPIDNSRARLCLTSTFYSGVSTDYPTTGVNFERDAKALEFLDLPFALSIASQCDEVIF